MHDGDNVPSAPKSPPGLVAPPGPVSPPGPASDAPPAAPFIPAQRSPQRPAGPFTPDPETPQAVAPRVPGSNAPRVVSVILLVALAAGVGVVVNQWGRDPLPTPAVAATVPPSAAPPSPPTPFESAEAALRAQAEALLAGDERGWLAAVDPAQPNLRARYRTMYRSLRGLGVSSFHYYTSISPVKVKKGSTTVPIGADAAYCLGVKVCPPYLYTDWDGPPRVSQRLTLKPVRGRYVITGLAAAPKRSHLQPAPWEDDLVFAQGRRVTVAATRSEAKRLKEVVALADRAAVLNDRFARYVRNPQQRYRVYLASDKTWRSWYGGEKNNWIIGYEMPLNNAGGEVVLKMSAHTNRRQLLNTLQHEMGHVVTLTGGVPGGTAEDRWLREGIAEYIGWYPRPATQSWRRDSVYAAVHGRRRPTSIVAAPLPRSAGGEAGERFYGLGHFAVDCMAQTYGQRRLFDFVRLRLREDNSYDQASREAFGKPFAKVDKSCVAWIRRHA